MLPARRNTRFGVAARLACTLVLIAMGASACGEDADDADVGGSGSGSEKPVLTIGVIAPLDDGLTDFGHDIKNGVELAVKAANAADAVPGWTIEVRALDDSSDPDTGKKAAETLAADPTVAGVVGTYNSGVAREVAPILDEAGIVMVSPGNTDATLTLGNDAKKPQRPWEHYFRMVAADNVQGPFLADQATGQKLNFQRAAVISETKPVSKGLADVFADRFAAGGGEVVQRTVVPDGTSSFETVLAEIAPKNPDVIFFGGEYQVAADLRTQATAAKVTAPVMGGDGIKDDAYIEAAGDASEGDIASSIGQPVAESDTAAPFLKAYKGAGFTEEPGDFGPYAFDAANVIIAAAAKAVSGAEAGSISSAQRDAILEAVAATDTDGASGPIAFDKFGDAKTKVLTLYRVVDGAWTSVAMGVRSS